MKAIVVHGPKDLRLEQREMPELGADQVLLRMEVGGICGSDLHYYNHGGIGAIQLRQPMVLGHEVAGRIAELGSDVQGLKVGQLIAVSPSRPCQDCIYCHQGKQNHCLNMRFYGSAMPFPHIQGAFQQWMVAEVAQCAVADGLSAGEAAMAEPLSVVLHAAKLAGALTGKHVLVTGCGPIGLLAVMVARAAGAAQVVATDIADLPLQTAGQIGADVVHNVAKDADALARYGTDKGHFDVLFECTGVAPVITSAVPALRPRAVMMQLGLGGDMVLPVQAMTAKELQLKGSFRFHEEFFTAVEMMRSGRLDVTPLITATLPLEQMQDAFDLAGDRSRALKVQLSFT